MTQQRRSVFRSRQYIKLFCRSQHARAEWNLFADQSERRAAAVVILELVANDVRRVLKLRDAADDTQVLQECRRREVQCQLGAQSELFAEQLRVLADARA